MLAGAGTARWTNYLFAGDSLVGAVIERAGEATLTRYFHLDHLGSVSAITSEAGVLIEKLSFDAWGKRRHPTGEDDPVCGIESEATRGLTGGYYCCTTSWCFAAVWAGL